MSVYLCHPCGVTSLENGKGGQPICPRCKKVMIPKTGPGSIEEQFPSQAHEDTVFQLDLKALQNAIDPLKIKTPPPK